MYSLTIFIVKPVSSLLTLINDPTNWLLTEFQGFLDAIILCILISGQHGGGG